MVFVAGTFVIRKIYYGTWLPNTYFAKAEVERSLLLSSAQVSNETSVIFVA